MYLARSAATIFSDWLLRNKRSAKVKLLEENEGNNNFFFKKSYVLWESGFITVFMSMYFINCKSLFWYSPPRDSLLPPRFSPINHPLTAILVTYALLYKSPPGKRTVQDKDSPGKLAAEKAGQTDFSLLLCLFWLSRRKKKKKEWIVSDSTYYPGIFLSFLPIFITCQSQRGTNREIASVHIYIRASILKTTRLLDEAHILFNSFPTPRLLDEVSPQRNAND